MRSFFSARIIGVMVLAAILAATSLLSLTNAAPINNPESQIPGLLLTNPPTKLPLTVFYQADGSQQSLRDYKGKMLVVNLWATWCVPCVQEMPSLSRLQAQLGSDNFVVLAINQDKDDGAAEKFYNKLRIHNLAVLTDAQNHATRNWGVPGLPATYVVNERGEEIARLFGAAEWDSPAMIAFLRQNLPLAAHLQKTGL